MSDSETHKSLKAREIPFLKSIEHLPALRQAVTARVNTSSRL